MQELFCTAVRPNSLPDAGRDAGAPPLPPGEGWGEGRSHTTDIASSSHEPFSVQNPGGEYVGDLVVEESVLMELKAVKVLEHLHHAHCLNYLKATRLRVCLLLNFGNPTVQVKRIVNRF